MNIQSLEVTGDFSGIRRQASERLFRDPSHTVFDSMMEVSLAAEARMNELSRHYPDRKLWIAGSLGRREMLPNSDIDLFVIYDDDDSIDSDIKVAGVDKFEIGHIRKGRLYGLLRESIVESHQFTDGREVGLVPAPDMRELVRDATTPDHLLATTISEYFFYRYFDFPNKATPMGPNMKYSAGSSRETMFFNLVCRVNTGIVPVDQGAAPELLDGMLDAEKRYGIRPPIEAIDLLFASKNAAVSVSDKYGDVRFKYASPESLAAIYEFGKERFYAKGFKDQRQFVDAFGNARRELEITVDLLLARTLADQPVTDTFKRILAASHSELPQLVVDLMKSEAQYPHAVTSFGAWFASTGRVSSADLVRITDELVRLPLERSWGGLMAVACCPTMPDDRLSTLLDWLYEHEKGAYLIKLISRNTSASAETRARARRYFKEKAIVI